MTLMHDAIQDALDDITALRITDSQRTQAFATIERFMAIVSAPAPEGAAASNDAQMFWALQDTFECNLPSRLMPWIAASTIRLETLVMTSQETKPKSDSDSSEEIVQLRTLATHLSSALYMIQGISLCHRTSKRWLGRRNNLHILLDLMLASRHVPTPPGAPDKSTVETSKSGRSLSPPALTSIVMDTLLCILVDAPPAIRALEECNGVQAVVKILKRSGTAREVRMKCLEFLYFYLMDENSPGSPPTTESEFPRATPADDLQHVLIDPATPVARQNTGGRRVASSGSYTSTASSSSFGSSGSDHSTTSATSVSSSGSTTSNAHSTPTPKKQPLYSRTPSGSDSPPYAPNPALLLLKREVDYEPVSPFKPGASDSGIPPLPGTPGSSLLSVKRGLTSAPATPVARRTPKPGFGLGFPGGGPSRSTPGRTSGETRLATPATPARVRSQARLETPMGHRRGESLQSPVPVTPEPASGHKKRASIAGARGHRRGLSVVDEAMKGVEEDATVAGAVLQAAAARAHRGGLATRTTEEKKALLGGLLGNVDALVEGVRKAWVWGLA